MTKGAETSDNGRGARPTRLVVFYECSGSMWKVVLDPTHLPVVFFDPDRRDQIWGRNAKAIVLQDEESWGAFQRCHEEQYREKVVLEGPERVDEEAGSAGCFCFETDMGTRYCVCGM